MCKVTGNWDLFYTYYQGHPFSPCLISLLSHAQGFFAYLVQISINPEYHIEREATAFFFWFNIILKLYYVIHIENAYDINS